MATTLKSEQEAQQEAAVERVKQEAEAKAEALKTQHDVAMADAMERPNGSGVPLPATVSRARAEFNEHVAAEGAPSAMGMDIMDVS